MANKKIKIALSFGAVAGLLIWITLTGLEGNMQYFLEIKDLQAMGDQAMKQGVRVKGFLVEDSVEETGNGLEMFFLIEEDGHQLKVRYTDERPDTFKDGSEVLVEGKMTPEGYFDATFLMAKCPSKYEADYTGDLKNYDPDKHEITEGTN